METNGIIVPDPTTTRQYIADPVGGWMYVVSTDVRVEQHTLDDFQSKLTDAEKRLADAQAEIAELQPISTAFEDALSKLSPPPAPKEATSTETGA